MTTSFEEEIKEINKRVEEIIKSKKISPRDILKDFIFQALHTNTTSPNDMVEEILSRDEIYYPFVENVEFSGFLEQNFLRNSDTEDKITGTIITLSFDEKAYLSKRYRFPTIFYSRKSLNDALSKDDSILAAMISGGIKSKCNKLIIQAITILTNSLIEEYNQGIWSKD